MDDEGPKDLAGEVARLLMRRMRLVNRTLFYGGGARRTPREIARQTVREYAAESLTEMARCWRDAEAALPDVEDDLPRRLRSAYAALLFWRAP